MPMTRLSSIFLILILTFSCYAKAVASKPMHAIVSVPTCKDCNLIVISFTAARKRNMSLYGYKRDTTPTINKFFQDSFIFNSAFAPATLTSTDAVTLFFFIDTKYS